MEYVKSKNPEQYINEMVNVSFCCGKLVKDPKAEIKNVSVGITLMAICELALVVLAIPMTVAVVKSGQTSGFVFAGVIYAFIFLYGLISIPLLLMRNARKKTWTMHKDDDRHFDCDKEGLSYITDSQKIVIYWKSLKAVRAFKYSMIFIPKDIKTKSILAPIENFDNVKAFLAENNIEIPVIGNTALENA